MSEEESDGEKVKIPPKEPPGIKFFCSHLNSYMGKALLSELRNESLTSDPDAVHSFVGTLYKDDKYDHTHPDVTPDGVQQIYYFDRSADFRNVILQSEVIIYDLLTNSYEEIDYVIKTLKTSNLDQQKTLILLSTVMTWVNTPPKYKKE